MDRLNQAYDWVRAKVVPGVADVTRQKAYVVTNSSTHPERTYLNIYEFVREESAAGEVSYRKIYKGPHYDIEGASERDEPIVRKGETIPSFETLDAEFASDVDEYAKRHERDPEWMEDRTV